METPPPVPPKDRKPSYGRMMGAGAAIGAGIGFLRNTGNRLRNASFGAALGLAIGALAKYFFWPEKKDHLPPELPPALPPQLPGPPEPMLLAQVPQILDILVMAETITPEQQQLVLTKIQQGDKGFAGEIAVREGFVSQEILNQALKAQALAKTELAVQDLQRIALEGSVPHPVWLKANWGNNGVNQATAAAKDVEGMSAAANIAQNLVMATNAHPDALPELAPGIVAAANLSRGMAFGDSPQVPLQKLQAQWQETASQALRAAVAKGYCQPADAQGKPVDIEQFIAERGKEIQAGVAHTLAHPPRAPEKGQGR